MIDNIEETSEPNLQDKSGPSESIQKLLSDKNTTLEDLLKEDDLLQELRNNNEKLIHFFDKEKIKHLLDYIIKEPEINDINIESEEYNNKGYKFPFVCSQIFGLEIKELFKYFFMTNTEIKEEESNEKNKIKTDGKDPKEVNKQNGKGGNEDTEQADNRIELLDYLFTFLPKEYNEKNKLNYILCGYFSSLINNLLQANANVFLKYVYNIRKDVFNLLISHIYRKSISDALSNMLHLEKYISDILKSNETIKNNMNETRLDVLKNIFTSITINMDNEQLNSIYFFITGLFDSMNIIDMKDTFKKMIDNKNIIKGLINKPLNNLDLNSNNDNNLQNKRNNFIIIIDIIIFLLDNIKKLNIKTPEYTSPKSNSIKQTKISSEILDILPKLIKNNFNKKNNKSKKILQSFNEYELCPLGEYKIKIVELISNLIPYFKKISKNFDKILISNDFFKNAFEYLFEYEWNNLYQEAFLTLLKTALDYSAYHEALFNYLFNKLKLVEIIKSHISNEDKFKFMNKEISSDISHGYKSFLINLCYKINTVIGGTPLGVNFNISTEGSFEFTKTVEKNNDKSFDINYFNDFENENKDKNGNNDEKKGVSIESMKKYLNDDWKTFFNDNIMNVIKQYCDRSWPKGSNEMDIFDFLFQESNHNNENKGENTDNKTVNIDNINDVKNEDNNIEDKNNIVNDDKSDNNQEKEKVSEEENIQDNKNNNKVENINNNTLNENKNEIIKEEENQNSKDDIKEELKSIVKEEKIIEENREKMEEKTGTKEELKNVTS